MKRKEWVILAVVIAGVAALEVLGAGGGTREPALSDDTVQEAARPRDPAGPPDSVLDSMGAFRTVRLHVTGMT